MKKFFQILFFFCFVSCTSPVQIAHRLPKLETLSSLDDRSCDYVHEDQTCFVLDKDLFEIGSAEYSDLEMMFIMDVSISMEDNLEKIGRGFSSLMSIIKDFNWKMAFTTADHGDHEYLFNTKNNTKQFAAPQSWRDYQGNQASFGRLMPLQKGQILLSQNILRSSDKDYEKIFYDTITLDYEKGSNKKVKCHLPPYCQEGHEQPLRVLKSVIEQASYPTHNRFFDDDSLLAVFIVTDEEERAEDPQNAATALQVQEAFSQMFPSSKKMVVYGISIQDEKCLKEQRKKGNANYSSELNRLSKLTGGGGVDICQKDYSPVFSRIAKELKKHIFELPLPEQALISNQTPVKVRAKDRNGKAFDLKWDVDETRKTVYFLDPLKEGDQIQLIYYVPQTAPSA